MAAPMAERRKVYRATKPVNSPVVNLAVLQQRNTGFNPEYKLGIAY